MTSDEILLSYQRFFERILFSLKIHSYEGIVQILKTFHPTHQLGIISHLHSRDIVITFLSMTGLIHLFDIIVTTQDLPSSALASSTIPLISQLYQHTITRLKLDSSVCLFFHDLSDEDKYHLSNFHIFPLKFIPESIYQSINHNQSLVVQSKKVKGWKWFGIWIGLPLLFCFMWYWIFQLFKSFITPSFVILGNN
jgi:hypothetical protein